MPSAAAGAGGREKLRPPAANSISVRRASGQPRVAVCALFVLAERAASISKVIRPADCAGQILIVRSFVRSLAPKATRKKSPAAPDFRRLAGGERKYLPNCSTRKPARRRVEDVELVGATRARKPGPPCACLPSLVARRRRHQQQQQRSRANQRASGRIQVDCFISPHHFPRSLARPAGRPAKRLTFTSSPNFPIRPTRPVSPPFFSPATTTLRGTIIASTCERK